MLIWHLFPKTQFYFKSNSMSKAAGLDSLSGRFRKDQEKILAKPIGDLCNL